MIIDCECDSCKTDNICECQALILGFVAGGGDPVAVLDALVTFDPVLVADVLVGVFGDY